MSYSSTTTHSCCFYLLFGLSVLYANMYLNWCGRHFSMAQSLTTSNEIFLWNICYCCCCCCDIQRTSDSASSSKWKVKNALELSYFSRTLRGRGPSASAGDQLAPEMLNKLIAFAIARLQTASCNCNNAKLDTRQAASSQQQQRANFFFYFHFILFIFFLYISQWVKSSRHFQRFWHATAPF